MLGQVNRPESVLGPTALVMFGGTGDLAETKLYPALFHLFKRGSLPQSFKVLGISRKTLEVEVYRQQVMSWISHADQTASAADRSRFVNHVDYLAGDFNQPLTYEAIAEYLKAFDGEVKQCASKLFYLAVPPSLYAGIFKSLDEASLLKLCDGGTTHARILVEKPFGRDLSTAKALEADLCLRFTEDQIYRIDHYLAKEAIENIIALRFANSILSDSWQHEQIESINVRLLEKKDVANRGAFYDGVGALRDVGQNHVLQILALLAMSPSSISDVAAIRQARARVISELESPSRFVKGQYAGFRNSAGVDAASTTETYFYIETKLKSERFHGIPITLEAGKALATAVSDVTITFKPRVRFSNLTEPHIKDLRNVLKIQFSPKQTITLTLWVKKPGFTTELEERELVLSESTAEDAYSPEAYERVLYDCIIGDQTRFVSGAEVMAAWRFITPLLNDTPGPLKIYEPGSSGSDISGI